MHGTFPNWFVSFSKYFRHFDTDCVLSNAFSAVRFAAMQTRVAGCSTLQIEAVIRLLRYGVSMNICVWPVLTAPASISTSFFSRSYYSEGR